MMMRRVVLVLALVAVAAGGAACGRMTPPVKTTGGYNCVGFADDLKTLREGDELPRVIQVLGVPARAYRTFSPFGRNYDVLEYDVGKSPCVRAILHSNEKLQVIFDNKGRYMGFGEQAFMKFRRVTTVRVEPLVIDPVILNP